MHILGIDPAADAFVVSSYPAAATTAFDNTAEGIAAFLAELPDDALVAVENTGVYSEALCYALHEAGVALALLDPHALHRAFPGTAKTDALDSRKAAEYAARFHDRLPRWQPHAAVVEQVRVLLSTRERLVEQKTAMMNARQALRRKVVQTPAANAALDATVAHLKGQVAALEEELRRLIGAHPTLAQGVTLLLGVPGVGLLLSAHLLVLTGGFTEVPRYRALAQRLGVAPNAHESGRSVRRPSRSRGYGPPAARKLLHLAARSVRTHEGGYRRYFEGKVGAGKAKAVVLNAIANRLLRVMCAVLREGQPYQRGHVSLSPVLLTSHRQSG
jgi:transposase